MTTLKCTSIAGFLALAAIGLVHISQAATIRVPDDQPTIQAGINAAAPGDSVLVQCGTYFEYNVVLRPSIVLRSETGDANCVTVDAQELGQVVSCPAGVGPDTRIEGLTLTRGLSLAGAAMRCESASPSVVNCAFVSNHAATIIGVGGVALSESRSTFTNCVFVDNAGYRGAISASNCPALNFINCTFHKNWATREGSALCLSNSSATLSNCIIAFGTNGEPVHCADGPPATVELRCCDIYGNLQGDWVGCIAGQAGEDGNFSLDPVFCDAPQGDFRVSAFSPCSPEHSPPGCGLIGARPVGCGPQEIEPVTWGRVKSSFR